MRKEKESFYQLPSTFIVINNEVLKRPILDLLEPTLMADPLLQSIVDCYAWL